MMIRRTAWLLLTALLAGCHDGPPPPAAAPSSPPAATTYPLHRNITATVFWVGEPPNRQRADPGNAASAWDDLWQQHFGGFDDPSQRRGYLPAGFVPRENPFYVALPYNDFSAGRRRANVSVTIPWAGSGPWARNESLCKNRWIRITCRGRTAYAQWEDVGPFVTDDAAYVFGTAPPRNARNRRAGLDVAPAVRDYLGLNGMDTVDWQFVEEAAVPDGPWKQIVTQAGVCWR